MKEEIIYYALQKILCEALDLYIELYYQDNDNIEF